MWFAWIRPNMACGCLQIARRGEQPGVRRPQNDRGPRELPSDTEIELYNTEGKQTDMQAGRLINVLAKKSPTSRNRQPSLSTKRPSRRVRVVLSAQRTSLSILQPSVSIRQPLLSIMTCRLSINCFLHGYDRIWLAIAFTLLGGGSNQGSAGPKTIEDLESFQATQRSSFMIQRANKQTCKQVG